MIHSRGKIGSSLDFNFMWKKSKTYYQSCCLDFYLRNIRDWNNVKIMFTLWHLNLSGISTFIRCQIVWCLPKVSSSLFFIFCFEKKKHQTQWSKAEFYFRWFFFLLLIVNFEDRISQKSLWFFIEWNVFFSFTNTSKLWITFVLIAMAKFI